MADYKVELGVKLKDGDIQSQINDVQKTLKPIEIKVDAETKELTNTIKEALNSLSKGTKNALTLDTSKLESSLNDVTSTIREIKTAIGSLDSGSGMKSLVGSINSISTALDKASNKFDELVADLKSLSGKDFNLNLGINLGGSNSVTRQGIYGNKVRSETLPQLKQQVNDLVKYYNTVYKQSLNEFEALQRMVSGTKLNNGDFFENFIFGKDSVATRMGNGSLSSQMQAYKAYIDMFKQAAGLKGIDLSSVTSGFSKSADELIKDAQDIQTGAKEAEDSFDRLKQVFGSGSNLNIEGLSASLEPIIKDLAAIREAIEKLSKGASFDGLTASFKELNATLDVLKSNFDVLRSGLGNVGNISGNVGNVSGNTGLENVESDLKEVGATAKKTSDAIEETINKAKKLDNISIDISDGDVDNLRKTLKNIGFDDSNIENAIRRIKEMGVTAQKVNATFKDGNLAKWDISGIQRTEDGLERIVTLTSSLNKKGNWVDSDKFTQSMTADLEKLKSLAKEINSLEIKLFKADQMGNTAEVERLSAQLEKIKNEASQLRAELSKSLPNEAFGEIDDIARKGSDALQELANKANQVKAELAKNIKLDIEFGNYDNEISGMIDKFNKLSSASNELYNSKRAVEESYRQLKNAMNMSTGDEVADTERLINAQEEYARALEKANNLIRIQAREEKKAADKLKLEDNKNVFGTQIDAWLKQNSAAVKQFGAAMAELKSQIQSADSIQLNHLKSQFKQLDNAAEQLGVKGLSSFDKMKAKFKEYASYLSAAEVFSYAERALESMFEQVKLVDAAMTELKKVTDESDASYAKFLDNAGSRAKALGTTIDGLVSSTADFARLGYGFKDSQGLAEVANIYAVVGDEIEGVEGATESLISTLAAFKDEMNGLSDADFALSIVDVFNEIGNNFAISSGGLGEAFKRSASSMAAANNTLRETAALITAANTVVQNPEKIGNGLKTISMRIRGAKTELEEAGESTEGMAESTATLRKEILALSGVDIMLDG